MIVVLIAATRVVAEYKQRRDDMADVDDLRRLPGGPIFYVGESFEGLPLTRADMRSRGDVAVFDYGDCEPAGSDGGCATPLQIQNVRCSNGRTGVAVFANRDRAKRARAALRPINRPSRRTTPMVSLDRNPFVAGC